MPSIKGFEVLMGPNRSQRMQSINGVTNNSITFTYILMATAEVFIINYFIITSLFPDVFLEESVAFSLYPEPLFHLASQN